jgi:hypothetical protein
MLGLLIALACHEITCGAGTTEENGQCVKTSDNDPRDETDADTDSDSDSDTDSDTDTDTDADTDTDSAPAAAWKGEYVVPTDGTALQGDLRGDSVGYAFSVGDFNGDGALDIAAPAVLRDDGSSYDVGQMAVALGPFSTDVDLGDAWVTIPGEASEGGYLGVSSVGVPDLDGDGADELLVAAPSLGSWTPTASVYLFEGLVPGDLALADADVRYVGENDYDYLGTGVATTDLDGDGTADLVLGASGWAIHSFPYGTVYGIDGTATDTQPEDAPLRIDGGYGSYFGSSVTALGDIDGDGADDLAIGGGMAGLSIFHGPLSGSMLATAADATVKMDVTYQVQQGSVAPAGDVDGDGITDLLVGCYFARPIYVSDPGEAWLINGTQLHDGETSVDLDDWTLEGVDKYQSVGWAVASAGDVDGDDYAEVLVGAPGYSATGDLSGAGLYFRGPLSGTAAPEDNDASFQISLGADTGRSMVPANDVTGDGRRDVLVGDPGIAEERGAILIVHGLAP